MNRVKTISHFVSIDEKRRKLTFNKTLAKVINDMYKNQYANLKAKNIK